MTHILRFHTEIGKNPVVLDPCPWPRKNFKDLGLDLKVLGLTTTVIHSMTTLYKVFMQLDFQFSCFLFLHKLRRFCELALTLPTIYLYRAEKWENLDKC